MIEPGRSFQHEFAVPVASLRVYERLEAFSPSEQAKILARPDLTNQQIDATEREEAMQRLIQPAVDPFPKKLDSPYRAVSYPTEEGGFTSYYCPSQLTERVALACAYFDDEMRPSVREAIIPVPARESFSMRAADYFGRSLDEFLREHAASLPITDETLGAEVPENEAAQDAAGYGAGLYSQHSTWGVPTTWFWLIDPAEDVTVVVGPYESGLGTIDLHGRIHGAARTASGPFRRPHGSVPPTDLVGKHHCTASRWKSGRRRFARFDLRLRFHLRALVGPVADSAPSRILGVEGCAHRSGGTALFA